MKGDRFLLLKRDFLFGPQASGEWYKGRQDFFCSTVCSAEQEEAIHSRVRSSSHLWRKPTAFHLVGSGYPSVAVNLTYCYFLLNDFLLFTAHLKRRWRCSRRSGLLHHSPLLNNSSQGWENQFLIDSFSWQVGYWHVQYVRTPSACFSSNPWKGKPSTALFRVP